MMIRRFLLLAIAAVLGSTPAAAMNLLPATTITTAISPAQVSSVIKLNGAPRNLTAQFNFTYGSGGTTADAYLQTSLDGGLTWTDIANFHVTTSSARKIINLNSQTAETTQITPTDGSMTSNTAQDGVLGPQLRVKYQSTGTYAGGTTLQIDIAADQLQ